MWALHSSARNGSVALAGHGGAPAEAPMNPIKQLHAPFINGNGLLNVMWAIDAGG